MNIDELFKEKLTNREVKVSKDLWNKLDKNLNTSNSINNHSNTYNNNAFHSAINSIKHLSLATKIITSSIFVATVVGCSVYIINQNNNLKQPQITNTTTHYNNLNQNNSNKIIVEDSNHSKKSQKNINKGDLKNENNQVKETYSNFKIDDSEQKTDLSPLNTIQKPQITKISPNNTIIKQYSNHNNSSKTVINFDTNSHNNTTINQIKIKIPSVITPNGDGVNDYFIIKNIDKYPDNILVIMNRNGKVVFSKYNYKNDFCGEHLAEGAYFYSLKIKFDNKTKTFNGSLTILH